MLWLLQAIIRLYKSMNTDKNKLSLIPKNITTFPQWMLVHSHTVYKSTKCASERCWIETCPQYFRIILSHRTMNSPSNILICLSPSQITKFKHVEILQQWKAYEFQTILKWRNWDKPWQTSFTMRIQSFWIVKPSSMVIDSWHSKGRRNINTGETSNLASVQVVGVPLCTNLCFQIPPLMNNLIHTSHFNGFSPLSKFWCLYTTHLWLNDFLCISQWNERSPA